jgi:hypothetical protein
LYKQKERSIEMRTPKFDILDIVNAAGEDGNVYTGVVLEIIIREDGIVYVIQFPGILLQVAEDQLSRGE